MEDFQVVWLTLAVIGGLRILCFLVPWAYSVLFGNIVLNQFKYGFVLITGASDGIGKALAQEFARRGFNLLLVSRSLEKLEKVKALILSESPSVTVELIAADLSFSHRDSFNYYNDLASKLSSFTVSVLVNNVGVADIRTLLNSTDSALENMIGVNVYPSTFLTYKLLPQFLQRYQERKLKSLIINFASVADEAISVGMSVYSATKRFNSFFSEGLRFEYPEVEVATVKPGPVRTALLADGGEGLPLKVDVDDYVRSLLNGLRRGVNHGHFKHKVMSALIRDWPYLVNVLGLRLGMPIAVKKDDKSQESLDKILRRTGATMPIIESMLSRVNKSLAQDQEIQETGNKTHEYRPDKRPRRWIYLSCLFICVFYTLNLIDYYFVRNQILTFAGLGFMFTGLLILFLFIYKNANITKPSGLVAVVHDSDKLIKIEHFLNDTLPDRNKKLKVYGLKFEILDGATIELAYI